MLQLLSDHELSKSSEVVLVEWNPCYANSKAEEGACDPRPGTNSQQKKVLSVGTSNTKYTRALTFPNFVMHADGYLSLEQVVRELVLAPPTPTLVRILYVSEEVHDAIHNPYDFDLLEFMGKNVAARRARGKYLLFANPDDVWTVFQCV